MGNIYMHRYSLESYVQEGIIILSLGAPYTIRRHSTRETNQRCGLFIEAGQPHNPSGELTSILVV